MVHKPITKAQLEAEALTPLYTESRKPSVENDYTFPIMKPHRNLCKPKLMLTCMYIVPLRLHDGAPGIL